jgi:hypothetical protein
MTDKKKSKKTPANVTCICCGKSLENMFIGRSIKPHRYCIVNGNSAALHAGYGSKYDMDMFAIYICDDCVTLKLKDKVIRRLTKTEI